MNAHEEKTGDVNKKVDLDGTLEHVRNGYQNAQDTIRFVDTKTGAVIGLSTLALGGFFGILTWFFGLEMECRQYVLATIRPSTASLVLMGFSSGAGSLALFFSLRSLVARPPLAICCSVLFPFLKKQPKTWNYTIDILKQKILGGMTGEEIRTEYCDQMLNVGVIVERKICWHRRAVWALTAQLVLLAAAASIISFGVACGY
jgi:hypothetical protein